MRSNGDGAFVNFLLFYFYIKKTEIKMAKALTPIKPEHWCEHDLYSFLGLFDVFFKKLKNFKSMNVWCPHSNQ